MSHSKKRLLSIFILVIALGACFIVPQVIQNVNEMHRRQQQFGQLSPGFHSNLELKCKKMETGNWENVSPEDVSVQKTNKEPIFGVFHYTDYSSASATSSTVWIIAGKTVTFSDFCTYIANNPKACKKIQSMTMMPVPDLGTSLPIAILIGCE
ncbi:MAG: hypothetical protein FWF45_06085 [Coriobacteriia bacterium]|nr:hypothetical protein [Coriobacteriia bacterium]